MVRLSFLQKNISKSWSQLSVGIWNQKSWDEIFLDSESAPNPINLCLYVRGKRELKYWEGKAVRRHKQGLAKVEFEFWIFYLQEATTAGDTRKSTGDRKKPVLLQRVSWKPLLHCLNFGLQILQIGSGYISVIFSHTVSGSLLWMLQRTNAIREFISFLGFN